MIGQVLDHYRIESKLGEGGMGVVYEASDIHLSRWVAIKVLRTDRVADPSRKKRFVQEAKTASALNHPNIVTIYDIRSDSGIDFIVMERIDGKTLDNLIAPKGMRPAQALNYAVQMADGLAKAHGAGILHRDLKPSNIMVTGEEGIKILDFGLAKLLEPEETSPEATTATVLQLTEEGHVAGTTAYMSPEQAEGRKLDARSDIFSFGSVLYEMTTGRRPFVGDSRLSILTKILNDDPTPPAQLTASIPPEIEKIILRCLRKDPARRYQTMTDLKLALEDAQAEPASGRQARRAPPWRRWAWAGLLPVLLIAGFLAWRGARAPETTEPPRAVPLTALAGVFRYPSFSPDGDRVAFSWDGPKHDNPNIYVQQISAGDPLRLTHDPRNDYSPVWSPDGRSIAFLRRHWEEGKSELLLIPSLGGPERKVTEIRVRETGVWPPYLTWCPDGKCLVVADSAGEAKPAALFVLWLETGEKNQLTNPRPPSGDDTNPAVSPDGKWLVFRRNASGPFTAELYRLALGKGMTPVGNPQRLTPGSLDAAYPTWMAGSKEILFSAKWSLWRLAVAGENPGGSPPARLPFVGQDGMMPVVSRAGSGPSARLAYVRSFQDFNIWRVETSAPGAPASSTPVLSISSTRREGDPQFSPDGRRVLFWADRSGDEGIWTSDADGSKAVELTSGIKGASVSFPCWSPDGERVVFSSNFEGQWDVYTMLAAGGKPRNLTSHPAIDGLPTFSRDGNWIYFGSNRTGEFQIWKMPASGGNAVQVTKNVGMRALESPDGAYIYYMQTLDKPGPLWRVPAPGGVPSKVLDRVVQANFEVLEKGIYYIDRPSAEGSIHYIDRPSSETRLQYFDYATRRSTTVARNLGIVGPLMTVSADGRTIFYGRMDSAVDELMLVENFR